MPRHTDGQRLNGRRRRTGAQLRRGGVYDSCKAQVGYGLVRAVKKVVVCPFWTRRTRTINESPDSMSR